MLSFTTPVFAQAPVFNSFTPATCPIGTPVTLNGSYFTNTTAVTFGGVPATSVTYVNHTKLIATVGAGASGNITVTNAAGTATLGGFNYVVSPVIQSFSPEVGAPGTTVTINGTNFGSTPAENIVYFGATQATVSQASVTSLTVTVPSGATFEPINVLNTTTGLIAYSSKPFIPGFNGGATDQTVIAHTATTNFSTGDQSNDITAGDIDGDGKPDLVTANAYANTVSVYRNISVTGAINNTSLAPKINIGTGGLTTQYVLLSDLNGDGKLDIITGNLNNFRISILQNQSTPGTISFKAAVIIENANSTLAIADIDGDGRPDIIQMAPGYIGIYRNLITAGANIAATSFSAPVSITGVNPMKRITVGDVNRDGKPDIITSNATGNSVSVFQNAAVPGIINENSLTRIDIPCNVTAASCIATADIDGDNKQEIVVLGNDSAMFVIPNIATSQNLTSSSFGTPMRYITGVGVNGLAIADLDGDYKPEIMVSNYHYTLARTVSVFKNISTPGNLNMASLAGKVDIPTGTVPGALVAVDIDGDAKQEIALLNTWDNNFSVFQTTINTQPPVITGITPDTAGTGLTVTIKGKRFSGTSSITFGGTPAASFKLLADTVLSVIVANGTTGDIKVTTPLGTATRAGFTYIPAPQISSITPMAKGTGGSVTINGTYLTKTTSILFGGVAAASFKVNSDNSVTAIIAGGASGTVTLTTPFGTATLDGFTFVKQPIITGFSPKVAGIGETITITGQYLSNAELVTLGDMDASSYTVESDNTIKAVVGMGATGSIVVRTPGGTATLAGYAFSSVPTITSFTPSSAPAGTTVTVSGSFFGITPADNIVYFGAVKANVLTASKNQLSVRVPYGATYAPISVTTNKLTGYSKNNFILTFNGGDTTISDTSFAPKIDLSAVAGLGDGIITDLYEDGKPDLLTGTGSGVVSMFKNTSSNGVVSFDPKSDWPSAKDVIQVSVSDFNGDGKPDLTISGHGDIRPGVVYRNTTTTGNPTFATPIILVNNLLEWHHVASGDIDNDGKPDIAVVSSYGRRVSVFRNTTTKDSVSFAEPIIDLITSTDRDFGICITDLDGDGKADIAVTSTSYITIFRNTGSLGVISFAGGIALSTRGGTYGLLAGDIDGDGKTDLAAAISASSSAYTMSVFRNISTPGNLLFATRADYTTPGGTTTFAMGDLNGDGKPDIVTANGGAKSVSVFQNNSQPGTITLATRVDYILDDNVVDVVIGDFDADGKPEITALCNSKVSILKNKMNNLPAPEISSFTPTSATTGVTITITGASFTGATSVVFGNTAVASFTVVSDTEIKAVLAAGASGDVQVLTPQGTASKAGFTYILPVPEITTFLPNNGGTGTEITIKGNHFTGATNVIFGSTAAASFTVVSNTEIKAIVGAGASGNVQVITPQGTASVAGFTFIVPAPVITTFLPNNGGTGTEITIKGNHFTGATNVIFGSTAAASFTVVSNTEIKAIVGAGASGNVQVITPQGTASVAGFTFIIPAPVITTFLPTSGGTNTEITIRGSHFTGTSAVSFGGTSATSFIVVSDSVITAIVGTGASGSITIVTTNGTTNINGFTFVPNTGRTMVATPNPATGFVMVNHPASTGFAQIKLIDMQSNIISNIRVNPAITTTRVELAGIKQGIYTIYWTDGSDNLTQLILVQ